VSTRLDAMKQYCDDLFFRAAVLSVDLS